MGFLNNSLAYIYEVLVLFLSRVYRSGLVKAVRGYSETCMDTGDCRLQHTPPATGSSFSA